MNQNRPNSQAKRARSEETQVPRKDTAEGRRLGEAEARTVDWKHFGPYVSDRAWATVREDYSANGDAWDYFTHDQARSRAYRWNEDGLAGFCNRFQNICLGIALWNERDPILKERLFGLDGHEGNHAEDVKEYYYYLDATPTHSYMKMLYKYPQVEYPYEHLVRENAKRSRSEGEYELFDAIGDVFREGRYFDIFIEYAKAGPEDILCRITAVNRSHHPSTFFRISGFGTPGRGDMTQGGPRPGELTIKPSLRRIAIWASGGGTSTAFPTSGYSPRTTAITSVSLMSAIRLRTSRTPSTRR